MCNAAPANTDDPLIVFQELHNSFGNTRGRCLLEALYNTSLLRINVLVFVMHTEVENCCINNSHYLVVHTIATTPLGKGRAQ